jgi:hypothetical protein
MRRRSGAFHIAKSRAIQITIFSKLKLAFSDSSETQKYPHQRSVVSTKSIETKEAISGMRRSCTHPRISFVETKVLFSTTRVAVVARYCFGL